MPAPSAAPGPRPGPALLFALWPTVDGRPHPESRDPWGERHAADCLTGYHDEDLGPFLTVAVTDDGETCHILFAGDAGHLLRRYAATVAEHTGHPPFEGSAVEQARDAFAVAVEETASEHAREACYDWCEPDPDTSRSIRRMPEHTRRAIREGSEQAATDDEARHLDAFLCDALGIDATTGTLRPLARAA